MRTLVVLPSGERLVIRDVTTADGPALGGLFASLSEEDRYRRFFSCFHPDDRFLQRLVTVGERGGAALVAELAAAADDSSARIVAEAEFVLLPNGNCELSMFVAAPFLILSAFLFACGVLCFATKRNAIGLLMGVVFGFALEKARVFEPGVIVGQAVNDALE